MTTNAVKEFFAENKKYLAWLSIAVLFLSLLPVFETVLNFGLHSWVVPPSYIDDNYYYVRMKEIVDGQPMLGNPYLKEHAQDIAPTWVFPDWISSLPLLAGAPLFAAISINFSFWSLVLSLLLYLFLRRMGLPCAWGAFGAFFCYTQVYIFVLRPISMQLIFPVFMAYLLAWFAWQEKPEKKNTYLFLGAVMALTFYDYPFLWQIAVVFSGLMFLYFLWQKDVKRIKFFLIANALTFVLLIPFVLFTLRQISHPYYWETMARTGLVATHLPTAVAFYTGAWIFSLLAALFLLHRWVPELQKYNGYVRFIVPFSLLGIAMSIVSASNLLTGKEIETANHVERFVTLWLALGTVVLTYHFFVTRKMLAILTLPRKFFLGFLALLVIAGNLSYAGDLNVFLHPKDRVDTLRRYQEYLPAFNWLDREEPEPQVVWIDPMSELRGILPVYTKHYVLYSPPTILHLVSDDEIQERYLTARYLSEPTALSMAKDAGNFAGVARGFHLAGTHNRKVKICRLLQLPRLGYDCGTLTDSVTLNTPLAQEMLLRYTNEIKPNIEAQIKKFNVRYIMIEKEQEAVFHPESFKNIERVYGDQRSVIYRLN